MVEVATLRRFSGTSGIDGNYSIFILQSSIKSGGFMSEQYNIDLDKILKHPQVKKAIDDINPELRERREYRPPQCEVFTAPFTILRETDEYRFELDREAEKHLPNIIGNKVQFIEGSPVIRVNPSNNSSKAL